MTHEPNCQRDDDIIEALSQHFRAHEYQIIKWLMEMDLQAACKRIEEQKRIAEKKWWERDHGTD
jgi:hypothetical protein